MLCALVLELRHTGKLAEHGVAVEDPSQLRVSGDVGLNVKRVFLGIETCGNVERKRLIGAAAQVGGNLTHGDGVHVHHAVERLIFLAVLREIAQSAKVISDGQISAWLNTRIRNFFIL